MSDDDLIRRVDARRILEEEGFLERSLANLNDLPAMQVAVKPLEWRGSYGAMVARGLDVDYYAYQSGWSKSSDGVSRRAESRAAAMSAAQSDYAARIRSALTIAPVPDAGKVQALVDAAGHARLALSGYVSQQSACDKLDAALAAMKEGE